MTDGPRRPWGQRPEGAASPALGGAARASREAAEAPRVFRVAEVNRAARQYLEKTFRDFWVEGEVSQAKESRYGHIYFALSDEREQAMLSCVLFANDAARVKVPIRDGVRLKVRGNLTLFEPRGNFQMQVRVVLPAGEGDLAQRRERVRQRLDADGLFAVERKRPLPRLPKTVGVVTSRQGAALQDVIRVAQARCPVRLVVADCVVQGESAPRSIVEAITSVQRVPGLDVIIVCRGGGSAEDLWSFDHEAVCRAVAACRVPVVCGVGHESDVSLAELVADARASTPSNAAELVVPARDALVAEVRGLERRLVAAMDARLDGKRLSIERAMRRLGDARRPIGQARAQLLRVEARMRDAFRASLRARAQRLDELARRVRAQDPRAKLARDRRALETARAQLERAMRGRLSAERSRTAAATSRLRLSIAPERATLVALGARADKAMRAALGREERRLATARTRLLGTPRLRLAGARGQLAGLAGRLDALSPLRVLERGYAIAFGAEGRALRDTRGLTPGDPVRVRLHRGELSATITEVHPKGEPEGEPR